MVDGGMMGGGGDQWGGDDMMMMGGASKVNVRDVLDNNKEDEESK